MNGDQKGIIQPIKYFGQIDMDETIYALYRKRYTSDLIYQEQWNQSTISWNFTTGLMRLITGGDCSLSEIQEADAMKAFPMAFQSEVNDVPKR